MINDTKERRWLDRYFFAGIPWLTNEVLLFSGIVLLAVFTRLWGLGERVMSHDESLHTYFSWLLSEGSGYQHNPMMHGPLQFHLLAITYFLFGSSDFTARLPHAIASILTIILIWKWRKYLGQTGSIIAALLALISPFLLYYGRYARNETFIGVVGLLMLYSILRYFETGNARFLYLLTLSTVLHFTLKETAFIYTAQTLLFLAIVLIVRVTRAPWNNKILYYGFIIIVSLGVLLLGATFIANSVNNPQGTIPAQAENSQISDNLNPSDDPLVGRNPLVYVFGIAAITSFISAGIILIFGYGWNAIRGERAFDMLILLGTFVLPQLVAFPIKFIGRLVDPASGWDPLDYSFQTELSLNAAIKAGNVRDYIVSFFDQGIVHTALVLIPVLLISILIGIWWNKKLWLLNAVIWYVIFIFFYTTFFTNGQGFFTGMVGSLGYWLEQQGVNRGSQPWYYYLFIQIPLYEFLPAIGLAIAVVLGIRRRSATPLPSQIGVSPNLSFVDTQFRQANNYCFSLLIWWSASSFLAYTIAGEKMPWLTFHIALPMILSSGWALGQIVDRLDWQLVRRNHGLIIFGLLVIFLTGFGAVLYNFLGSTPPFQGKSISQLNATTSFLFSVLAVLCSTGGLIAILLKYKWDNRNAIRLLLIVFFVILAALTSRASIRAVYIHDDDGTEYLVYAHGARGIKDIMEQVEEISRRTAGETDALVAYDVSAPDTGVSWPFTWYLRNYHNTRPFDQPTKSLRDAPIIIVDQKNFDKILPVVGDSYYQYDYLRMVWPNQDYFGLTWDRVKSNLSDPRIRQGIFEIWLNRDYAQYSLAKSEAAGGAYFNLDAYKIPSWEPSDKMRLYIRKDIAVQIWEFGVGPTTLQTNTDPYEGNVLPLTPDRIVGSSGSANGQLNSPHGIAFSPDGSFFVADTNNHRVQHFSASGTYLNGWGSYADATLLPASITSFNQPWGIAVSPDGNWIYVTDTWNHRIIKFSSSGNPITSWGSGQYGGDDPYGLWGPRGIAVDPSGNVFVSDTGNKRIIAYSSNGVYLGHIGTEGLASGQFSEPVGIAFGLQGDLFVADTWNQRVQVLAVSYPDPNSITMVSILQWDIAGWYGQSLENKPYIAISNLGNVFITDPDMGRVIEFTPLGEYVRSWGSSSDPSIEPIGIVSGIAADDMGHIFVTDPLYSRILRFTLP